MPAAKWPGYRRVGPLEQFQAASGVKSPSPVAGQAGESDVATTQRGGWRETSRRESYWINRTQASRQEFTKMCPACLGAWWRASSLGISVARMRFAQERPTKQCKSRVEPFNNERSPWFPHLYRQKGVQWQASGTPMANYSALPAIHEMAKRAPRMRMDPRSQSAMTTVWNGRHLKSSQALGSVASELSAPSTPLASPAQLRGGSSQRSG